MARPLLTLGFLVDTLLEDYQRRLFAGVCSEAARLNVNVHCFIGGPIASQHAPSLRNRIYQSVHPSHLDGLIVAAGSLGNESGHEGLVRFLEGFAPLPICSLGVELPGAHCVLVDNEAGVREALNHLIIESGCKRIAFTRGPSGNREAEERFRTYQEVLTTHRLGPDPDLITIGNFEADSGAQAVSTLLDERHVAFDAIFSASDLMALGALNSLLERGISVPARVSLVGFDDIDAARYAAAPLTTVKQPLTAMGKHAVECVLGQIYRGTPRQRVVLPAKLVRRQSSRRAATVALSADPSTYPNQEAAAKKSFSEKVLEFDARGAFEADFSTQLWNTLLADASGRRPGLVQRLTFLSYVEYLLLSLAERGGDVSGFQSVLTELRRHLLPTLDTHSPKRDTAEQLLHEARTLVGSIAERRQVQYRLQAEHFRRVTAEVAGELLRAESWQQLGSVASAKLSTLGIQFGALCTYTADSQVLLRLAWDGNFALDCPAESFSETDFLPPELLAFERRHNLVVEPLYSGSQSIGYVLLEVTSIDPEVYLAIRDGFAGALRGLMHV